MWLAGGVWDHAFLRWWGHDAGAGLAHGLAVRINGLRNWVDLGHGTGREAGRDAGRYLGRGGEGEKGLVVADSAGGGARLHSYGGASGVAGGANDFEDGKTASGLLGINEDARFFGLFLIDHGDAESAVAKGGNADEGVVVEWVGGIYGIGWRRFGGEG